MVCVHLFITAHLVLCMRICSAKMENKLPSLDETAPSLQDAQAPPPSAQPTSSSSTVQQDASTATP
jgi:hypothetical protein